MKYLRISRILIFLGLTFLLSWGFDLSMISMFGLKEFNNLSLTPWGMFAPALSAIILQRYFFKDSPIYHKSFKAYPIWIYNTFLSVSFLYGVLVIVILASDDSNELFIGLGSLLLTLWTLSLFFVFSKSRQPDIKKSGLSLGKLQFGSRFILYVVLFFIVQAILNIFLNLGSYRGTFDRVYGLPIPADLYIPAIIILFVLVTVIGIPLSGLAAVFGEEYGWRGFLQTHLNHIGKLKAALIIGIIWGIWHIPVILRSIHTYQPTLSGIVLAIVFFALWGIIQSYVVFKTGSVLIAAFLHGVVNSVYGFISSYIVLLEDKVYSFGLGIYGLICISVIVLFVIRDPAWKSSPVD